MDQNGIFASDIMLGYRYYVASKAGSWGKDTAADSLWPLAETEKFTLWENAPVGDRAFFITKADYEAYAVTEAYTENVFENQNRLSELLFHTVPIDWKKETYLDDQTGAELSCRFYADGKQILYLYGKDLQQAEITVNGERLYVPDYNDLYNESYPATGNQGILSLGVFRTKTSRWKSVSLLGTAAQRERCSSDSSIRRNCWRRWMQREGRLHMNWLGIPVSLLWNRRERSI